jgi:hypothetical protein
MKMMMKKKMRMMIMRAEDDGHGPVDHSRWTISTLSPGDH